jgi:hypothetical protein
VNWEFWGEIEVAREKPIILPPQIRNEFRWALAQTFCPIRLHCATPLIHLPLVGVLYQPRMVDVRGKQKFQERNPTHPSFRQPVRNRHWPPELLHYFSMSIVFHTLRVRFSCGPFQHMTTCTTQNFPKKLVVAHLPKTKFQEVRVHIDSYPYTTRTKTGPNSMPHVSGQQPHILIL